MVPLDHGARVAACLHVRRVAGAAIEAAVIDSIEAILDGCEPYTREQFEADRERIIARLCEKHGITAAQIPDLIRRHDYEHTAEDPEDDYIQLCAFARAAGWIVVRCPHSSHGSPSTCSQCIGVVPKRVEQDADVILIDGVPVRAIASPMESMRNYKRKARR